MGGIKHSEKPTNEQNNCSADLTHAAYPTRSDGKSTHNLVWTVSLLMLIVAFGTVNVFQLSEILSLKRRVDFLERNALGFGLDVSRILLSS